MTLAELSQVDGELERAGAAWLSLSPERTRATRLGELGEQVKHLIPRGCEQALAGGLAAIARAEFRNFPENIFWDFDFTAASLLVEASRAPDPAAHLAEATSIIVALQDLFGSGTEIRFRYGHDFIYGFDWAKWVNKAPAERAHVGPFDLEFLRFLLQRGHELTDLIEDNDTQYPKLTGPEPRNPFAFSREPDAEARLHRSLARDQLLPVESWRLDAAPVWDRPFQRLRLDRAEELGLIQAAPPARAASRAD